MGRLTGLKPALSAPAPRLAPPPKTADPFYLTQAWRALVASIKRRRGNRCEQCGSPNRVIGDHIVERSDGGADLDPNNVELLCIRCHNRKTAAARARRGRR